jgi:hypothetical protein
MSKVGKAKKTIVGVCYCVNKMKKQGLADTES